LGSRSRLVSNRVNRGTRPGSGNPFNGFRENVKVGTVTVSTVRTVNGKGLPVNPLTFTQPKLSKVKSKVLPNPGTRGTFFSF